MTDPSWQELSQHYTENKPLLRADALLNADPVRAEKYTLRLNGLLADFSKNGVSDETLRLLCALADARGLDEKREALFSGGIVNTTENRAALHTALRAPKDGVRPEVHDTLSRMADFAEGIRNGTLKGHAGEAITDIVNIGIGGSYLGPEAAYEALAYYRHPRLKVHFVSNVEASQLHAVLATLRPETTLYIIASKTFTTAETMMNARIARDHVVKRLGDEKAVAAHFTALSTNTAEVQKFGISANRTFPFWDWVGGRYSVWSAIGLSVMLAVGADNFRDFLQGAHDMDVHFKTAPHDKNIPVLMGLIGVWHRNFCGYPAYACIPYHSGLRRIPAWLQQLDMESNGKHSPEPTGPIVFGEPGTDAQHSFFQWLHQSTDIVPVDFIAAVKTGFGGREQQKALLANMLAQSEGLMTGRLNKQEPHRNFPGGRPSTVFLLDELTPRTLGMLMAAYEHKVFTQGVIWGINSFDQWGVELGKVMAKTIEAELSGGAPQPHDSSTAALIEYIRKSNP